MKTPWVVGIVVAVHALAVGFVMLLQGCGTTVGTVPPPPEPEMPPTEARPVKAAPSKVPVRPAKTWPTQTTIYVVRSGDMLSEVAKRFNISMAEILALNGLKNADFIRQGQKLILPGKVDVSKPRAPVHRTPKPEAAAGQISGSSSYVVKSGDSLSAIAVHHGVKVAALRQANGISGDKILIGQTLKIPGGKAAPAAAAPPAGSALPDIDLKSEPAVGLPETVTKAPQVPAAKVVPAPAPPAAAVNMREHVVGEGEDLYSVSLMWDVSVARLKDVNGLADTTLKPGQVLKVPLD